MINFYLHNLNSRKKFWKKKSTFSEVNFCFLYCLDMFRMSPCTQKRITVHKILLLFNTCIKWKCIRKCVLHVSVWMSCKIVSTTKTRCRYSKTMVADKNFNMLYHTQNNSNHHICMHILIQCNSLSSWKFSLTFSRNEEWCIFKVRVAS